MAVSHVALQHGDDLVVGLAAVNHAEAADGFRPHEEARVRDGPLGQHADVHRVAVAANLLLASQTLAAEFGHALTAERLRDEAVQRRRDGEEGRGGATFQMPEALSSSYLTASVGTIST